MGWFIAQSLAFIIIAALIGLAIGIWIGWLVWGRRKGKHTAEKSEAVTRANTAEGGTAANDGEADAAPVRVLAAAGAAGAPGAAAASNESGKPAGAGDAVDAKDGETEGDAEADQAAAEQAGAEAADETGTAGDETAAQAGEDEHAGADGSAVVAEAEAVTREAAEQAAAAKAAALAEAADETAVEAVVEPATAAAAEPADDLRRIEGIGPKIAAALAAAGYTTYAKIAGASEDELREAVAGQGIKFAPAASSWADQARYLVDGDTAGFEEYQDYLVGGQERRAKFNEKVDYTDVDEIEGAEAKAEAIAEDEAAAAAAERADAAGTDQAEAEPEIAPEPEPEPEPEPQDLQRIEGIGPKIETALTAAGYTTYAKVAGASEDELRAALTASGIKFAPAATSWADQAQYLVDGDEDGLREYQDYLIGGQERRAKFNENVDYTDVDEVEGAEAKAAALAEDEAEAAAAPETAAEPAPEPEPQDLQRIEGIGPKIETALKAAGYATYAKIAAATETEIREALATGGIKFAPAASSWADQAQYLADGDEDGLQEFQDYLIGGQDRHAKFRKDVDYTDVDEIEGAEAKAEAIAEDEAKAAAAEDDTEPTGSEVKA